MLHAAAAELDAVAEVRPPAETFDAHLLGERRWADCVEEAVGSLR